MQIKHGLERSVAELEPLAADDRANIASFLGGLRGLRTHYDVAKQ